ncbi:MAG: DUF2782 domain-containing protein [Nitrosomonas sp. PRO4]|nr:DUF2782 domain-containing protein [Nitrosomonas sp. PRO4]
MIMYRFIFIMLLSSAIPVMAQSEQPNQPKKPSQPDNLIPLPEISELPPAHADEPQPPDIQMDPELETHVTIIKRGEDTIEEHRVNGELLMIKVIPRIGPPYYLKRNTVKEQYTHPEAGIDVSPPMWQLFRF